MTNTYDQGNLVRVRFAFPSRTLTDTERATYAAGGDLPTGVGFDPDTVCFDHKGPGAANSTTHTYPSTIVREAAGQYHVDIDTTSAATVGDWDYRGYSTGNGQASIYGLFHIQKSF